MGGIAGAAAGIPGILIGSAVGGHVAETGFKKIVGFSKSIKRGKKVAEIAEAYRNGSIGLTKAKQMLSKIQPIGGSLGDHVNDEVDNFLKNGDNSTYQKWLNSGEPLHDYLNGLSSDKNKKSDDSASDEAAKSVSTSEGSGPSINSATLKARNSVL